MTEEQQVVAAELVAVFPDALVAKNERTGKLCQEVEALGVCGELKPREDTWPHGAWLANPAYVEYVKGPRS